MTMSAPSSTSTTASRTPSRRVARVELVGAAVALQLRVDGLAERAVERARRTSPRTPGCSVSVNPRPRAPRGCAATWPSIMPESPSRCGAGRAPARAPSRRSARGSRRCRRAPSAASTPQWPWSVNSSRHRSVCTTSASPTSATSASVATFRMPRGSSAPEPRASRTAGTPKSMMPPTPAVGGLRRRAAERVERVLHDAGHRPDRRRLGRRPRARRREHQLRGHQVRLAHESAHRRRLAQAPRADGRGSSRRRSRRRVRQGEAPTPRR